MAGITERTSQVVERLRGAIGAGETPVAKDAEGRTQIVREALRAFGDGDFDRFFGSMDEEVEWRAPEGRKFPGAGTHSGRAAIAEHLLGDVERTYASFGFRPETYLEPAEEDLVVVLGSFIGEPVDGDEVHTPAAQVWEFEKGKVSRVRILADSEALAEPREEAPPREEERTEERGEQERTEERGEEGAEARGEAGAEERGEAEEGEERKEKKEEEEEEEDKENA
jgi:ketosteroid isomerase-like protein